jgi:hypothetical protein
MARSKGLAIFVRSIRLRSMPVIISQELTIMNEILITMSRNIPKFASTMHGPKCIAQSP